jgi:hypothetical protein
LEYSDTVVMPGMELTVKYDWQRCKDNGGA